ncbi:3-hydroxyacyl-CoA dehydrogenase NAD-binding domain-containing protein [Alteromonas halophila]|uniref:3-hydroxyacyl-CoA dehydrogenase n=1 Tax=Alteromonas halophila TaxID=516698 RepID=A0A918N0E8_9ALTE|nr:3-hydroxyacyl-CoA dehydrogenase NAD-binding domain-containing protein [Alteromonas halophila]GGW89564.1 3-hydroxyacyl-CoA dehydrogenase [Alteromonas halophila]
MTESQVLVSYRVENGIATFTLNNAPVNALSLAVRTQLQENLEQAVNDASVTAIVITSALPMFSAGADISEFSDAPQSPMLPDVLNAIEQAPKPVVAVLPGPAFGGGLELALACHYRISVADNKVGLPEVNLGILPGAGGTQRLPRLASAVTALEMIVTGKPRPVLELKGVFDKLADNQQHLADIVSDYIGTLSASDVRPTCENSLSMDQQTQAVFEQYQTGVEKKMKGFFAPAQCIEAVKAAFTLPFAQGLKREQELFMACMDTPQARAQQHFFFAERAASHVSDFDKTTETRAIKSVAVIGAGTMGGGIAMNFANAGIPVTLVEREQSALDKGLSVIRKNYESSMRKGRISEGDVEQRMAMLSPATDMSAINDADLVIEAVFEKLEVKQAVFEQMDAVCKRGAILATNTSTLDINQIAAVTSRPSDVIGLHFFSPANVMKLLEVVKTSDTSADVIKSCMQMAKRIKKVPVLVGVCFGFVGNRMLEPYAREANRLLLEGATPERIDRVITDFGMPMGPFTMGDMAGLDIGYFVRQSRQQAIAHDPSYAVVSDRLVEQGRVGLKAGKGVYLYEEGSRVPIPDPAVLDIAREEAQRLGIAQREDISDEEILVRCLYTLINEGAQILEEGIADKPSDIDVIYVYGYGFPVYRGGPMHYADEIGPATLLERLEHYQKACGEYGSMWLTASDLVKKLAAENKTFGAYQKEQSHA